jgi:hypothetical protein
MQYQELFDEDTAEKAKELADKFKKDNNRCSIEALIARNSLNKQLFDVILVDYDCLQNSTCAVEAVEFQVASKYVKMYNRDQDFNETTEDTEDAFQAESTEEAL